MDAAESHTKENDWSAKMGSLFVLCSLGLDASRSVVVEMMLLV